MDEDTIKSLPMDMPNQPAIGVLVQPMDAPTVPPNERPIGRAATLLFERGIDVIFGDTVSNAHMSGFGFVKTVGPQPMFPNSVHDRYPSQFALNN